MVRVRSMSGDESRLEDDEDVVNGKYRVGSMIVRVLSVSGDESRLEDDDEDELNGKYRVGSSVVRVPRGERLRDIVFTYSSCFFSTYVCPPPTQLQQTSIQSP